MTANKGVFAENLARLLKSRGKTQQDLVFDLDLSQSTVSDWFTAKKYPRIDNIQMLADYFGVYKSELTEERGYHYSRTASEIINKTLYLNIPLYQNLSCGEGMFVEDNIEEYIQISDRLLNPNKNYFAQVANGDSMIEENIQNGDILIFEKTDHIENGQVGCFCVDENMATCKKFFKDDASNIIMLNPANSDYQPIVITIESMNFHVVGKLKLVINRRD